MLEASVIGLGTMGSTLAQLLLQNGYHVTVWNRTIAKAKPLVQAGAVLAPNAAAAIHASRLIVVCVHDYPATNQILDTKEVAAALAGRILIQLTTGSPQEARDSESWAKARGADYLDGAIQAAPSQMGRPDTPILVSGAEATFRQSESLLKILGGNLTYLGEQVSAASAMDLATLSYIYGAVLGFFHGAHICEAEGFRVDTYGSIVADIAPSFGEFLKHEGAVIQSGDYAVSESPLKISVEATERLVKTAQAARINAEFPIFASGLFKRAMAAGYGDEEAAALVKPDRGNRDLFEGILQALRYQLNRGTLSEIRSRVYRTLKACQVEMLIVDEAHRLKQRTFSELQDILDALQIAIVLVGTDRLDAVMPRDEQVHRRFIASHRYERLTSAQLVETSAIWETHVLRLPEPSNLGSAKMQKILGPVTGGYLGLLDRILREAAVRSLSRGLKRIEFNILNEVAAECR